MIIRSFIYSLVLVAYSLSLAHSVIPHHHFDSYSEFKAGHSREEDKHDHSHSKSEDDRDEQSDNSPFVGAHVSNIDFSVTTYTFKKKAQGKTPTYNVALTETSHLLDASFENSVFHIPIRPPLLDHSCFSSRLLRAPPVFS